MTHAMTPSSGAIPPLTLPIRLELARRWRGMNQTELGVELGVDRSTISRIEQGRQKPARGMVISWAAVTDTDITWLCGDDMPPPKRRLEGSTSTKCKTDDTPWEQWPMDRAA